MTKEVYFVDGPKAGKVLTVREGVYSLYIPVRKSLSVRWMGESEAIDVEPCDTVTYRLRRLSRVVFSGDAIQIAEYQWVGLLDAKNSPKCFVGAKVEISLVHLPCPDFMKDFDGWWKWQCWHIAGRIDRYTRGEMFRMETCIEMSWNGIERFKIGGYFNAVVKNPQRNSKRNEGLPEL